MTTTAQEIVAAVAGKVEGVSAVGTVYQYAPPVIDPGAFPTAYVFISGIHETRKAVGGAVGHGRKWLVYDVTVWLHTVSYDASTDQHTWYDLLASVQAALRGDPSLGSLVFRFGEEIDVENDRASQDGDTVEFSASITSPATVEVEG